MPNVFSPDFDSDQDRPGFTYRRAKLAQQAGAQNLGVSLYEIPPGQATFPYHAHTANEELLIVLDGTPSLRTTEGWRQLETGEVVGFRVGDEGAHQVANRSDGAARVLLVSTMVAPEVNLYPDSGKLMAATRAPGAAGEGLAEAYRREDARDYWEGEEPPGTDD
ncbi:MAG: cupin domain-containing protein [Solirubrobacterales bacterium]